MTSSTEMVVCPSCGSANRAQATFCATCGATLTGATPPCPNCGVATNLSDTFCSNCGKPLGKGGNGVTPIADAGRARGGGTGQLPANTTLHDRYLILRRIAVGGMGAVYEATDLINGKRWAVKEMSESSLLPDEREQAVADFQREATILRTFTHPNLPKVADLFNIGGRYYMVMEFVAGRTLMQVIDDNQQPISWARARSIALQLCDVLGFLHQQNPPIIYRDLKPGNVMVQPGERETVKLIDFGIARFHQPGKTRDTTTFGTAGYAPPEQYGRDQTDARSDIYALGATLHHLLSRRDPGLNPFNFGPIRDVNPTVPVAVEQAILKATSTEAASRWPDTAAFRNALIAATETKNQLQPTNQQRRDSALRPTAIAPSPARRSDSGKRNAERSGPLTSEQKRQADIAAAGERALVQPRLVLSSTELDFGTLRPAEVKARRDNVGLMQRRVSLVNAGSGNMKGKVSANRDWLKADVITFDTTTNDSNVRSINLLLDAERLPVSRKRPAIANVYRPLVHTARRMPPRNLVIALTLLAALLLVVYLLYSWMGLAVAIGAILLPQAGVLWYALHQFIFVPAAGDQIATVNIVSNGGERSVKVRARSEPTRWQVLRGYILLGTALALEAIIAMLQIWQQLSGMLLPNIAITLREWFAWLGFS